MSEQSAQTKKKLAQNADKITLGVLALILLALGFYYWKEQNNNLASGEATRKPANLTDQLAGTPSLNMLQNMSGTPTLESNPDIARLAQLNMFDLSTVEAEKALENQAMAQLQQAQTLIAEGKTSEAHAILVQAEKAVAFNPEIKKALDATTSAPEAGAVDGSVPPAM